MSFEKRNSVFFRAALALDPQTVCPINTGDVGFWLDAGDGVLKRRNADGTDVAFAAYQVAYAPVRVAVASLPNSPVYSGTALTYTAGSNAALVLDGQTMAVGDRFLRYAGDSHDGIYVVTVKGSGSAKWVATRAGDNNASADFSNGAIVNVYAGTFANAEFALTIPSPFTMDTDTPVFTTETLVQRFFGGVGHNGAGAVTLTGAKVGDKVVGVVNATDGSSISSSFESTITVADQIQQSSATDLSAKKIAVLLNAKS